MPAAFDRCVAAGGKVRTVNGPSEQFSVPKGKYRRICILKGQVHLGEVKEPESLAVLKRGPQK